MWTWKGTTRPPFAQVPLADQESVWDYPRPPIIRSDAREVIVRVGGIEVVRTTRALRVLETASPPGYYLPFSDVLAGAFTPSEGVSNCEWKGAARYWTITAGGVQLSNVGWSYDFPVEPYRILRDHVAVYATHAECTVNGERVRPQDGGFYGGWVTNDIAGPWKGAVGTGGW